jgi:hypothetical protein
MGTWLISPGIDLCHISTDKLYGEESTITKSIIDGLSLFNNVKVFWKWINGKMDCFI